MSTGDNAMWAATQGLSGRDAALAHTARAMSNATTAAPHANIPCCSRSCEPPGTIVRTSQVMSAVSGGWPCIVGFDHGDDPAGAATATGRSE